MGSLPQRKLPVFDLSLKNRDSWVTKCDEVTRALEEYGCFIAMYDGVSQELHDAFAVATQDLYELPVDQKALNTLGPSGLCYMGYLPAFPLFEGLRMENATSEEGAEKFTKLMWSSGNQNFRESCLMFSKALAELEEITMRMVAKSYGIEKDYELLLRSTTHVLKFNKCRVPRDNENNVAVIPHTDKCFMSVIRHQTEGKGRPKMGSGLKLIFHTHLS